MDFAAASLSRPGNSIKGTDNREGVEQMMRLARRQPRKADLIMLWGDSRFSLNTSHAAIYCAELRHLGWQVLSMRGDIPTGQLSRFYAELLDWTREQFLSELRTNTKRGLLYIAERGCVPVGPLVKGYQVRQQLIAKYKDGTTCYGRKPEIDHGVRP